MKRREFLKTAGVGAAAVAATTVNAPAVIAEKSYRWKMVTAWPSKLPVLQTGCERLAKRIGELSDGRLQIQVFAAGELIPTFGGFDAVSKGSVEIGSSVSYYWNEKIPVAQWFAAVPFGMNAQGMSAWFHGGDGLKLWEDIYAPFNLIPRPGGATGVQMGGWFNKKIESIDDYKGLKIRMPGLGGKVMTKAGAIVIIIPSEKILSNLKSGIIDAAEWIGPLLDLRLGLHQAAKYYYYPGWHEPGTHLELLFNKKAYESLPKDLQCILDAACREHEQWVLAQFEARNGAALQELIAKHKVEVIPFPDEVLNALRKLTQEVLIEESEKDPLSNKVYASFNKFQKVVGTWGSVSEKAYYNIIQPKYSLKG